ncbi:DUF3772 domain-containing protein [Breoghania sp.]|uniref:DUF3772 domain-containing protein n=1 Tax=Breoghania sp. TaxID=2065378 RepID=UPI0026228123|nr:DUF3772 domain-containing protein [Breoghania sp.]MDJ0931652.1 DUF3772 domain-containing protein [Breoghania sp.]
MNRCLRLFVLLACCLIGASVVSQVHAQSASQIIERALSPADKGSDAASKTASGEKAAAGKSAAAETTDSQTADTPAADVGKAAADGDKDDTKAAAAVPLDPTLQTTLDGAQRRIDGWGKQLDRIEADLQRKIIEAQRVDEMRSQVLDVRSAGEEIQSNLKPRGEAIEKRVKELSLAEGSKEAVSDAVTAQLDDQQAQLAAVNGVLKQVQVVQLYADELLTRIIQYRRDQLIRRLLTPTPSILEPHFWSRVAHDLQPTVKSAGLLISDWFGLIYARAGAWAVLLVVIALIGTYGLIWPVRRLLLDLTARDPGAAPVAPCIAPPRRAISFWRCNR